MPLHYDSAEFSVSNATVSSSGTASMTGEFTCYNCLTWPGGSLNPMSSSQQWIYAVGPSDQINSDDVNYQIDKHSMNGNFALNMASAVQTAPSGSATQPAFTSAPTSSSEGTEDQSNPSYFDAFVKVHAVLLGLAFMGLM